MNQDIHKLVEKFESDRSVYLTDHYNKTHEAKNQVLISTKLMHLHVRPAVMVILAT